MTWAEENKLELPPVDENTKRAGIAHWAYPQAYTQRGTGYPDSYLATHAADAMQKMGYAKKAGGVMPNNKAPSDGSP